MISEDSNLQERSSVVCSGEASTGFRKKQVRLEWAIEDFHVHRCRLRDDDLSPGEDRFLDSCVLDPLSLPGSWRLRAYPFYRNEVEDNGARPNKPLKLASSILKKKLNLKHKIKCKGAFAVFLVGNTPVDVNVGFTISILDDQGAVKVSRTSGDTYHLFRANIPLTVGFEDMLVDDQSIADCLSSQGSMRIVLEMQVYIFTNFTLSLLPGQQMLQDVKNFIETQSALEEQQAEVMRDAVFVTNGQKVFCSNFLLKVRCEGIDEYVEKDLSGLFVISADEFEPDTVMSFVDFLHTDACDMLWDSDEPLQRSSSGPVSQELLPTEKRADSPNEADALVSRESLAAGIKGVGASHIQIGNLVTMAFKFKFLHLYRSACKVLLRMINFRTASDIARIALTVNATDVHTAAIRIEILSGSKTRGSVALMNQSSKADAEE